MNASGIGTLPLDNASTPLPSANLSSSLNIQTFLQLPSSVDDPSVKAAAIVGMVVGLLTVWITFASSPSKVVYEPPLHPSERSWLLYPFQFFVNALFPVLLIAADEQKRFRPVQRYLASLPTWTPMYTRHSELRPERRSDFDATTAGSGKPRLHHPQHTFSLHWCDGAILISRMVQTRPDYTSSASNPRGLRHLKIRIFSLPLLGGSLHSLNILTFLHNADAFFRRAGPTSNVQILESYVATSPGAPHGWKFVESRAPRSIKSVILEGNVGGKLLEDLKSFMFSKAWYRTKVIPHQKGVLFFGLPGTGKTSLAFALASELRLDLYVLKLNDLPEGDKSFNEAVASAPSDCIILVEGIDYRFDDGYDRIDTYSSPRMDSSLGNRRLSLAGMLSFLDGTSVVEGRIVIATSNQKEMMHSALRRPGRIDFELRFDLANQDQLQRLFQQTLFPTEKEIGNMNAQARFDVEKKRVSVMENAELFSKVIPERKFSAASIQSYLVRYKDDPVGAVRDAKKWVEDQTDRYSQRSRSTPRDQHHLYPLPDAPRHLPQPYDDDYRPRPPPSIPSTRSPRFVDPPSVPVPRPRSGPNSVDSSDSEVQGRPKGPEQAPPPPESHPYTEPMRYTSSDTNHLRRRDTGERTEKDEREYELQRRGGVRSSTDEGW